MNHEQGLGAIARGQHGAFLFEQAHQAGIPAHVLRGWISSGLLDRFGTRTLRSALDPPTEADLAASHILDLKPVAWLARHTAASIHHLDTFGALSTPFHVVLERGAFAKRNDLVVHTTNDLPLSDRVFVDGLPVTNPVRTIIDLARSEPPKRLTAMIDGALRDRLLTEETLLTRIAQLRCQGRHGVPTLLAVIEGSEASRGGHSWLERRYLELAAGAGLPPPQTQRHVGRVDGRLIRVDCYYPEADMVVELLGYRWHRSKSQIARDAERVNRLTLDGRLVLQFTYEQVTLAPKVVIDSVVEGRWLRLRQRPA